MTKTYFKGSAGALLVYDITEKDSFEKIDKWIKDLNEEGGEHMSIVLVGNKNDLPLYALN